MAQQHVALKIFLASVGSITDLLVDHFSKSSAKTCSAPSTDRWITVRYQKKILHMLVPTFPSFALDLCFTEILPFFV
jgi:hypothetical protein